MNLSFSLGYDILNWAGLLKGSYTQLSPKYSVKSLLNLNRAAIDVNVLGG